MWNKASKKRPPMGMEVIALDTANRISFAHIVNEKIAISYDGWNIPNIVFWQYCNYTEEMKKYYGED